MTKPEPQVAPERVRAVSGSAIGPRLFELWPEVGLALVTVAMAAANGWWIWTVRSRLPYNIDEAGYLQRAVRDGQHLVHGGLPGLLAAIRTPDIQAPLVPVVAALAYPFTHARTLELLTSLQVFYLGTVAATYFLARLLVSRRWAVLAAVLVALSPGVLDQSRSFMFAEAATATFTAAVAAQIAGRSGRSRGLLVLAGILAGLTTLSRTMMVAFIVVLWAVGLAAVCTRAHHRAQSLQRFLLVPAVGSAVAAIWYSAQWRYVLQYLTQYGYGSRAAIYQRAAELPIIGSLPLRLDKLLSTDLYVVLGVATLLGLVFYGWKGILRWREGARSLPDLATQPGVQLALVTAGALAALSSTANAGSGFELPLVPSLIVLACAGWRWGLSAAFLPRAAGRAWAGVLGAGAIAGAAVKTITVLPLFVITLGSGQYAPTVASSYSELAQYLSAFQGSGPSALRADRGPWLLDSRRVESFLYQYSQVRGYRPVVFFATEGPLFNTNTLQLEAQEYRSTVLPVGVFRSPRATGLTFVQQLYAPQFGIPNFLVAQSGRSAADFTVVPDTHVAKTAKAAHFREVLRLRLPDGTFAVVYWRPTGPVIASTASAT